MSKLLLDEQPILILPKLATVIGLNESIILQQIHYWIMQNETNNNNNKEGFYWVYNTFEEWEKQFPFWSMPTIKRIFKKLEDEKLLIVGNYNKKTYDRTKWYRIDYEQIDSLTTSHSIKMTQCIVSKRHDGKYQSDSMEDVKMIPPIPETNSETNYIYTLFEYWNSKGIIKHREFTQKRKSAINARLQSYTFDELKQAINNYKQVLDSTTHYWTHKWTLDQFMKPSNVERFTDEADPLNVFRKNSRSNNQPSGYVPMSDRYDPNEDWF